MSRSEKGFPEASVDGEINVHFEYRGGSLKELYIKNELVVPSFECRSRIKFSMFDKNSVSRDKIIIPPNN